MPTGNEEFRDAMVRHQVGLIRFAGSLRKKVFKLLDDTEADLRDQIEKRGEKLAQPGAGANLDDTQTRRRLESLEKGIKELRGGAHDKVRKQMLADMRELAKEEPAFVADNLDQSMPVTLDFVMPDTDQLQDIVSSNPMRGQPIKDWAKKLEADDINRITQQIRIGLVEGDTARQLARRVVGSARLRGTNGVTEITRRDAAAITRTATNHVASQSRKRFMGANRDLIDEEVYTATLDSRTSAICQSLDNKTFPVGEGPPPPLHFNCRSIRIASINDQEAMKRPANPTTQKMLLREYTEQNGLKKVTKRDDLPRGHKGAFDKFARARKRELVGQTPAHRSYEDFLRDQPQAFQEEVLGVKKAKLFREGELSLDKFVDQRGKELSLDELRKKEQSTWNKVFSQGGGGSRRSSRSAESSFTPIDDGTAIERYKNEKLTNISVKDLSGSERKAFLEYSGEEDVALHNRANKFLRGEQEDTQLPNGVWTSQRIRELDNAIGRAELNQDTYLYRGVEGIGDDFQIGDEHIENGFVSTSVDRDVPLFFAGDPRDALLRIRAPKGTKGMSMSNISPMAADEKEVLLRPGRFRVVGRTTIDQDELGERVLLDLEPIEDG